MGEEGVELVKGDSGDKGGREGTEGGLGVVHRGERDSCAAASATAPMGQGEGKLATTRAHMLLNSCSHGTYMLLMCCSLCLQRALVRAA